MTEEVVHRTAQFHNFTTEVFVGFWDGRPKTFKPGAKLWMPEYLARHFSKHLTNRVLIKNKQETLTSPKFPEQVPQFMELFNKAFLLQEEDDNESEPDQADMEMNIANSGKFHSEMDEKDEKTQLIEEATSLGLKIHPMTGIPKIKEKIAKMKSGGEKTAEAVIDRTQPQIITPPADDEDEAANFEGNKD